ncbi:MAG: Ig-like domain-containing protein [Gemmatimonadaceae bacterium]
MLKLSCISKGLVASAIVATFACSGGGESASVEPKPSGPAPEIHYAISLTPKHDSLVVGFSRMLTAVVVDGAGVTQNVSVQWTSLQPSIASVSGGNVTAISTGSAAIVARYGTASDTATVFVSNESVHLQVWPSAISASLGDTVSFTAQLVTDKGVALGVQSVSWAATDSQAVALVGDGRVEMRGVGDVDVIAKVGTMTASASVNVFNAAVGSVTINPTTASIGVGLSVDLNARVLDRNGRPVAVKYVQWNSSNPGVATVDNHGIVRGVQRGGVIITATSGGKTATATVNVSSQTSSSVTLSLDPDTIPVGFRLQAAATPRDREGNAITGRTIAYQSSNPSVATVNNAGSILAMAAGSTNLSAICDGHIVTVKLTVQNRTVASVNIVPVAPSVQQGSTATLVADVRDQLGQSMPSAVVTWTTQSPLIATVSPAGLVTAVTLGTAAVTATSGGISSHANVTVMSIAVVSESVSPTTSSLIVNGTTKLSATALGANGQSLPGAVHSWSVTNSAVASVSALGVVTAIAKGTTTVKATSGGRNGLATITVSDPPPARVDSVHLTVNSLTLLPGQTTQAVAATFDSAGTALTGRAIVWSSAEPTLASVSSSGLITALAPGSVSISATSEGVSGLTTITVSQPAPEPVASVTVAALSNTLGLGQDGQLTVVLKDAQGNVLTARSIAYSGSNTAVATVSSTGLVHAVAAGTVTISVISEGVTGTLSMTVLPLPPAPLTAFSVTVTLNANSLQVGQTSQGTAVVKDSLANPLSGQAITWSTSNAAVATVSSTGLVTAVGAGAVTISASTSGKTGMATLNVTVPPPVITQVIVSMPSTSFNVGQTVQASAVAKDAQNNVIAAVFVWSTASTTIAGVSASGLVSGASAGSTQVKAVTAGVTGSVTVTVNAVVTPPGPNGKAVPAELPRVYLNFPYIPAPGKTISVLAGGSLQNAINSAQRGDEIVLQAGATFTGNFTLPVKTGTVANGWITIRTDKLSQLPAEGTRVTPANENLMPKIVTPNSAPAIATMVSASGYRIVGVEVTVPASYAGPQYALVRLGDGSAVQNTLALVASDLVLDRVYVHGQTTTNLTRCVALNSARTQITDSYITECHSNGTDAQAIQGYNGPGPYKIVNNTLIASTENVAFGGGDPWITGMIPKDIEIRRNYLYTPASWKGKWLKKNLFELKAGQRILIEGNVLDGSWTDGQTGWAFMLKVANQSGGCTWCTTSDITIRYNYIRNAGAGIAISGREGSSPHPVGALAARFSVQNNVMDNISVGIFTGDQRFIQVLGNASDIEITNNTTTSTGYMAEFLLMETYPSVTRLVYSRNATTLTAYGMLANSRGEGTPALGAVAGGWEFDDNYLIGAKRSAPYPLGTTFVASLSAVPVGFGADQATLNNKIAGVIIP